jgi:type II secretory pathway component GspD/PulD (secretin)
VTTRLLALAALGGLLALLPAGHAQDRKTAPKDPPAPPPAQTERVVYPVRGGDPAMLAEVVAKHFRGEVVVSALPSALVLTGDPAAVAEATKLLDRIDRPARTVEIEVSLVEVTGKADAPAPAVGPDVLTRLDELAKAGAAVQRIKLTAVEGQPVSVQVGRNYPVVSGAVRGPGPGGGGPQLRSVTYQQVGTTVRATARVEADNAVAIDLNVQDNSVKPAEGAEEHPEFDTDTLTTRVNVPPGQAVVAQAIRKDAKGGRTVTLVVVTAKVVEPRAGK